MVIDQDRSNLELLTHLHRHSADIFKCIFMNEKVWIMIKILLKFVVKDPIDNNQALV